MDKQEKDYIFRVYRTVQQSVLVAVTSDREMDLETIEKVLGTNYGKEIDYLRNVAEYQAGGLPDGDWKVEGVETMYALFETMEE